MLKTSILTSPRWRTAAILKNVKCDISAAFRPILMKFGLTMHVLYSAHGVPIWSAISQFWLQQFNRW